MVYVFVDTMDEVLAHALRDRNDAHPVENGADGAEAPQPLPEPPAVAPPRSRALN
jgi:hypothetical protein